MSEPRRLLSGASDASALERALLGAGRQRREPEGMRDRVRIGVTAAVTAGAISATATTATTAKAATTAGTASVLAKAKLVFVAAALVSTAGATTYVAMKDHPEVPTVTAAPAVPAVPAPVVITPRANPEPPSGAPVVTTTTSAVPVVTASSPRARTPASARAAVEAPSVALSELREEAALVDEARSALAAKDLVTANERLARADSRFPRGRLAEEREALAVRIAAAGGDEARAARLARTFVERHPTSPLRPSMEAIAKKSRIE